MDVENEMSEGKVRVVVNFTKASLDCIDHLVRQGVYMNRQTVIRDGVRLLLTTRKVPPFYPKTIGTQGEAGVK